MYATRTRQRITSEGVGIVDAITGVIGVVPGILSAVTGSRTAKAQTKAAEAAAAKAKAKAKADKAAAANAALMESISPTHGPHTNWVPWVVGGVAVLALGGVVTAAVVRRSRRTRK